MSTGNYLKDYRNYVFLGQESGFNLYLERNTGPDPTQFNVLCCRADNGQEGASGVELSFGSHPLLTRARQVAQEQALVAYPLEVLLSAPNGVAGVPPAMVAELHWMASNHAWYVLARELLAEGDGLEIYGDVATAYLERMDELTGDANPAVYLGYLTAMLTNLCTLLAKDDWQARVAVKALEDREKQYLLGQIYGRNRILIEG